MYHLGLCLVGDVLKIVPWKITIIYDHLVEYVLLSLSMDKQIQVILSCTRKTCVCVAKKQDDKGSGSKRDEEL